MQPNRFLITSLLTIASALPGFADVAISTDATQNMSCSGGVCAPTASDAVLNVTDLENLLASGNVSVVTTNGSIQANNIDIAAGFSSSSASGLTLDAYQSITFSAVVSDAGTGAVSLVTNDGGSGGALTFAIGQGSLDFVSAKSHLSINGEKYKLVGNVKQLAAGVLAKPSGHFALSRDYNAGKDGTYSSSPVPTAFSGAFNGLGHAVSNLQISHKHEHDTFAGLFALVAAQGSLASVTLREAVVYAQDYAGLLAGGNDGTIINTSTGGRVRAFSAAGGIAGYNYGTITSSQSAALVSGGRYGRYAGGIAGENWGTFRSPLLREGCWANTSADWWASPKAKLKIATPWVR